MRWADWARSAGLDEFDALVQSRGVGMAFQPIVDLRSQEVLAYEALARMPAGSSFAHVGALFAEAYRRGQVGELDWVCRGAVFKAALEHKVPPELPLFLNVEPMALGAPCPADLIGPFAAATQQSRFVVEVTERSLAHDPGELIAAVTRTRDVSAGVALDDVGADPASLALMPLVAPDVIKLDLSLIQARPNPDIARIVNAVLAESERTGAVILAEGVESAHHVSVAQSMGATLGQGYFFGPPAPLPHTLPRPDRPLTLRSAPELTAETPFEAAVRVRTPVTSTRALLAATSQHLEREILHSSGKSVLLASFETVNNFGPSMQHRYENLARQTVLAAVFGRDMPARPGRGLRGARLHPEDPLGREWTVIVLGSQLAAALIARRSDDSPPDGPGEFEAIITHDRELVVTAAKPLLERLPPMV